MPNTTIAGYTYQAETLCPDCTLDALNVPQSLRDEQSPDSILETLATAQGIDYYDLRSFDSNDFPKVVFSHQLEGDEWCGQCQVNILTGDDFPSDCGKEL